MTKHPPWKTGTAWKDGKHYRFDYEAITVTQGWPGLRVWIKKDGVPWRGTRFCPFEFVLCEPRELELGIYKLELQARMRPELNPFPLNVGEFAHLMEMKAMLSLVNTIPPAVLNRVLPFWLRRWTLLCLQARVPGADDLLDSNPVLGWMLANHWVFRDGKGKSDAARVARRWVGKRQRDILEWLGFENSDSTRRIIARIPPRQITARNLLYLRNATHRGDVKKAMQHQTSFTMDTLRIVTDPVLLERTTPNLLREVTKETVNMGRPHYARKLAELLTLEKTYGFKLPRHIRSLEELGIISGELRHRQALAMITDIFPPAPWPGAPGIEPIANAYQLQREGLEMHHCAATYDTAVKSGLIFVYMVTQPVRATTLAVIRTEKGWKLHELAGVCNQRIDRTKSKEIWRNLTGVELGAARHPETK